MQARCREVIVVISAALARDPGARKLLREAKFFMLFMPTTGKVIPIVLEESPPVSVTLPTISRVRSDIPGGREWVWARLMEALQAE